MNTSYMIISNGDYIKIEINLYIIFIITDE